MKSTLNIKVNITSLECAITSNSTLFSDLKIFWQSYTTEYKLVDNEVILPMYVFKRSLLKLLEFIKNNNIYLNLDSTAQNVLRDFVKDQKSFKSNIKIVNIEENELQEQLFQLGFLRQLKKEQIRDVIGLLKYRHGANFSVPGAGKTTTILAVYILLKHFKITNRLIVVSPINAFVSWEDEVEEIFGPNQMKISRVTKDYFNNYNKFLREDSEIFLLNYEKLRQTSYPLIKYFFENKVHFVLDESHRIKSGYVNLSYKNIVQLADISSRRDIMSGTPMPQLYTDLIPQFDFLWPGENIIETDRSNVNNESIIVQVNKSIRGRFVRTKKSELGLKPPIINYNTITLGPLQKELYRLIKSEYARILSEMDQSTKQYFRSLGRSVIRLLQAATNPMLLTTNDGYDEEIDDLPGDTEIWEVLESFSKYEKPVKIEAVLFRAREIVAKTGKVVIWSTFVRNILLLQRLLSDYNPAIIYGAIGTGDESDVTSREGQIRKFHFDDSCKILIANPQACGEGISLHKVCHNAIYLDRNFNSAHYLQSMDRIHRLGLSENVDTVIDVFISDGTIDVPLISRLNEKVDNMGRILNDDSLLALVYDPSDIIQEELDSKDIALIKNHIQSNE